MVIDAQQIPLLTAVATSLAAVLIAPIVQVMIGFKQARIAKSSAEAAKLSAEAALRNSRNAGIQLIASSRQKWIDNLRDTLSEFHSITMTENEYPYPKEVDRKLSLLGTRVELLLNPGEDSSKRVLELINKIYNAENIEERESLDLEFVAAGQAILKAEWDRVKRDLTS